MLLAEALNLRADANKRLAQVTSRIGYVARFQEGEEQQEDALALVRQAEAIVSEIEELVKAINRTNASVELEPGLTLADAIAKRDALQRRRGVLVAAADAARPDSWGRQTRTEIRWVSTLPVTELREEADRLAQEARKLDVRLQQANWTMEVV